MTIGPIFLCDINYVYYYYIISVYRAYNNLPPRSIPIWRYERQRGENWVR